MPTVALVGARSYSASMKRTRLSQIHFKLVLLSTGSSPPTNQESLSHHRCIIFVTTVAELGTPSLLLLLNNNSVEHFYQKTFGPDEPFTGELYCNWMQESGYQKIKDLTHFMLSACQSATAVEQLLVQRCGGRSEPQKLTFSATAVHVLLGVRDGVGLSCAFQSVLRLTDTSLQISGLRGNPRASMLRHGSRLTLIVFFSPCSGVNPVSWVRHRHLVMRCCSRFRQKTHLFLQGDGSLCLSGG